MYLLDNGVDSLRTGVDFFEKYLNEKQESHLKLSLTSIHSVIEILSKETLSRVDELIIYTDVSNDVLDAVKRRRQHQLKVPLYNILINMDLPIQTISYAKSVDKLGDLFGINTPTIMHLKKLGGLRNKVTHFGINRELDFYEVIGVINHSIEFIIEFFYRIYSNINPHPLESIYDKMLDVLEKGYLAEEDYWGANHHLNFIEINNLFSQSCSIINSKAKINAGFELEFTNEGFIDSRSFLIDIIDHIGYLSTFSVVNITNLDITIMFNSESDEGFVYAYYDHKETLLYTVKQNIKINTLMKDREIEKKSWKKKYKGNFEKTALNLESVNIILKRFISDQKVVS